MDLFESKYFIIRATNTDDQLEFSISLFRDDCTRYDINSALVDVYVREEVAKRGVK